MITIDGSQGEGGGQIVRSSLALSLITGIPIRIENVRAGRKNPGLLRQHLTAFQAATQISNAQTHGAELGSKAVQFEPGTITPGRYRFSVGSAGSTTLVFQTVLPALMLVDGISHIEVEGGTHNPHAPPFDYLARVYFPLLRKLGANVEAGNCHPGFYPAGGGCFGAKVVGCPSLNRLELLDRGVLLHRRVRALVANLPIDIAERECRLIERRTNWDAKNFSREEIEGSVGAGNVVMSLNISRSCLSPLEKLANEQNAWRTKCYGQHSITSTKMCLSEPTWPISYCSPWDLRPRKANHASFVPVHFRNMREHRSMF